MSRIPRHATGLARPARHRRCRRARSSTPRPASSVRPRKFDDRGPLPQRRGGDRRDRQRPTARAASRATTTTPKPTPSACATASTGPATSATATKRASSTSRVATPTGCASTARTSRPRRSRTCSARHPDVVLAAVYAVPSVDVGDEVMAALHLHDGATFDPAAFTDVPRRAVRPVAEVDPALRAHLARACRRPRRRRC